MKFAQPLMEGRFVKRYKRFFADVELPSGEVVVAHTPNTGSLMGCKEEGAPAWVMFEDNPKRKLKYTWELIQVGSTLVGVHTGRANGLAQEAIEAGVIPQLAGYATCRREVKYGQNSRIDLLLEDPAKPPCYVEVKNVTLAEGDMALFPDAVTERGRKHLNELMEMVKQGNRAVMLFVVQREDCTRFAPAQKIDPAYTQTLQQAVDAGVEVLAWQAHLSPQEIRLEKPLPVQLPSGGIG